MKIEDFWILDPDPPLHCLLAQQVHDHWNIHRHGAIVVAGMAAYTDPDSGAPERLVAETQLEKTHDLVRAEIHALKERASSGAGLALEAAVEIRSGNRSDLTGEFIP